MNLAFTFTLVGRKLTLYWWVEISVLIGYLGGKMLKLGSPGHMYVFYPQVSAWAEGRRIKWNFPFHFCFSRAVPALIMRLNMRLILLYNFTTVTYVPNTFLITIMTFHDFLVYIIIFHDLSWNAMKIKIVFIQGCTDELSEFLLYIWVPTCIKYNACHQSVMFIIFQDQDILVIFSAFVGGWQ